MARLLVTGAAGFIGSNFVELATSQGREVVVLDALTYAGHKENLDFSKLLAFHEGDICDGPLVSQILQKYKIEGLINFAAESHVDRSITDPSAFIQTNTTGVFTLMNCALAYWETLKAPERERFRMIQVSTDEVFGTLGDEGKFTENTPYAPNSPYSASKAGGDLLARAWFHTYKLPVLITNCSNNYGPKQYPEKLIPLMIQHALTGQLLPVYGEGLNVRDWIHVEDHCSGVLLALDKGKPGESYCFGGNSERRNIDVVKSICALLEKKRPRAKGKYEDLITFVEDRKGHDWRYAIDDSKAQRELGFRRKYETFEKGLEQTIDWYLENEKWVRAVTGGKK